MKKAFSLLTEEKKLQKYSGTLFTAHSQLPGSWIF